MNRGSGHWTAEVKPIRMNTGQKAEAPTTVRMAFNIRHPFPLRVLKDDEIPGKILPCMG